MFLFCLEDVEEPVTEDTPGPKHGAVQGNFDNYEWKGPFIGELL